VLDVAGGKGKLSYLLVRVVHNHVLARCSEKSWPAQLQLVVLVAAVVGDGGG
jgi:hypothetical protein